MKEIFTMIFCALFHYDPRAYKEIAVTPLWFQNIPNNFSKGGPLFIHRSTIPGNVLADSYSRWDYFFSLSMIIWLYNIFFIFAWVVFSVSTVATELFLLHLSSVYVARVTWLLTSSTCLLRGRCVRVYWSRVWFQRLLPKIFLQNGFGEWAVRWEKVVRGLKVIEGNGCFLFIVAFANIDILVTRDPKYCLNCTTHVTNFVVWLQSRNLVAKTEQFIQPHHNS